MSAEPPVSLEHAVRTTRARRRPDKAMQCRTDLAEQMAEGCPSISEAARRVRISQSRADQYWQEIKRGLGVEQCK